MPKQTGSQWIYEVHFVYVGTVRYENRHDVTLQNLDVAFYFWGLFKRPQMPLGFLHCILYQFRKSAYQPLVFNLVPSRCSFPLSFLLLPLF